jgi:hypothetical protein
MLLAPGGILGSVLIKTLGVGSPITVLILSALIYSAIAYVVIHRWKIQLPWSKTTIVAVPIVLLACLACAPSVSPLWPRGMSELAEKERMLREGIPAGSDLASAQAFLRRRGIDSYEYSANSEEVAPQRANVKVVAEPGDRILSARVPTEAQQFPCSYRIEVILVFDRQEKLKQSSIARSPLCP